VWRPAHELNQERAIGINPALVAHRRPSSEGATRLRSSLDRCLKVPRPSRVMPEVRSPGPIPISDSIPPANPGSAGLFHAEDGGRILLQ